MEYYSGSVSGIRGMYSSHLARVDLEQKTAISSNTETVTVGLRTIGYLSDPYAEAASLLWTGGFERFERATSLVCA
jgi:hypothetical protein